MSPSEITVSLYKALASPNGLQSVRHLISKICNLDESCLSEGLLATFQNRSYTAHEVACAILWCLEIPLVRDPVISLREYLPNWDVSVEELPFYLTAAYGRKDLEKALREYFESVEDESEIAVKLNTFRWWMGADQEAVDEIRSEWIRKLIK
jgi:hypothetical protein